MLELCARKLACTVLRGPDPSNGVWLLGANPDNRLRPEMLANAEIPVGERQRTLLVPSDAIQQIDGQDIVFVRAAADRFTVRPVRAGETAGRQTPILDGLKPGEQIVVRGSFVLKSHLLKSTMESE